MKKLANVLVVLSVVTSSFALAQDKKPATFAGRVVDMDGKPVAGAKILVAGLEMALSFKERTTCDDKGQFRFTIQNHEFDPAVLDQRREPPELRIYLGALAEGHGATCLSMIKPEERENLTVWLPAEAMATGHIIDGNGQPVAGVKVMAAGFNPGHLDKDGKPVPVGTPRKPGDRGVLFIPSDKSRNTEVSDANGLVTLRGLSHEWNYKLYVSSPNIVSIENGLVARDQAAKRVGPNIPNKPAMIAHGSTFTIVVEPCKPITGVIVDQSTKKPIAGVELRRRHDFGTLNNPPIHAKTDDNGRYVITGLAHGTHEFHVSPPEHSPYLPNQVTIHSHQAGIEATSFDFDLPRQPVVTGRIVDAATGQPVRGSIRYRPLATNKYLAEFPNLTTKQRGNEGLFAKTDNVGRFTMPVPVGPGVIFARGNDEFLPTTLAKEHQIDGIAVATDRKLIDCLPFAAWPAEFHAYQLVEVSKDKSDEVLIKLQRGKSRPLIVEYPDGKEVATTYLGGRPNEIGGLVYYPGHSQVNGLRDDETRRVFVSTMDNRFAVSSDVRGNETGPVVVKLKPTGTTTGRVLDQDGQPIVDSTFQFIYQSGPGKAQYFMRGGLMVRQWTDDELPRNRLIGDNFDTKLTFAGSSERTDAEGRFKVPGVFPDVPFDLNLIVIKGQFVEGKAKIAHATVKSGESLDLGELRVTEKLITVQDEMRKRGG